MNLIFIGMMGSGKTSIGKLIAQKQGMQFIDSDKIIENVYENDISCIFATIGEKSFREIEKKIIQHISRVNNCIIATGGGVPLDPENICNLKKNGKVIWIKTDANIIMERVGNDTSRPILQTGNPEKKIRQIMTERETIYKSSCDIQVDTSAVSLEEAADLIINMVKNLLNPIDAQLI